MKRTEAINRSRSDGSGLVLLLSIKGEHAERIFGGSKHYELRRALPAGTIKRVYLYETGGTGVVGSFDVSSILHLPVKALWKKVGTSATTHERFASYFAQSKTGFAIGIQNPVRFQRPLRLKELQRDHPRLTAPQSYVIIDPTHSIFGLLENARRETIKTSPPVVALRKIASAERAEYESLVQKYIGANYDEIDASFARRNLEVHDLGHDPAGFFTRRKEVLAIEDDAGRLVGFTTLTYKSGDAVKTGPTIILTQYRRHGYGRATRRAIEARALSAGARKVYCTAPDTALSTIKYLLASGMRIEAHLRRHYSTAHDELVFGKFLKADDTYRDERKSLPDTVAAVANPGDFTRPELEKAFLNMFEAVWHPVNRSYVARIVRQTLRGETKPGIEHAAKPKLMTCLRRGKQCVGAIVLLPKRGGAVKGLLLRKTANDNSLRALVESAAELASGHGARKLYLLHPSSDSAAVGVLRRSGFSIEGVLGAPYVPGQDVFVLSKML